MSPLRWLALVVVIGYTCLALTQLALSGWRSYLSGMSLTPSYVFTLRVMYVMLTVVWIGLAAALCLLMGRIARLSHRRSLLWLTIIAAFIGVLLKLVNLALSFSSDLHLDFSFAVRQYASVFLMAGSAINYLAYWPTLAVLAWSCRRRESRFARGTSL